MSYRKVFFRDREHLTQHINHIKGLIPRNARYKFLLQKAHTRYLNLLSDSDIKNSFFIINNTKFRTPSGKIIQADETGAVCITTNNLTPSIIDNAWADALSIISGNVLLKRSAQVGSSWLNGQWGNINTAGQIVCDDTSKVTLGCYLEGKIHIKNNAIVKATNIAGNAVIRDFALVRCCSVNAARTSSFVEIGECAKCSFSHILHNTKIYGSAYVSNSTLEGQVHVYGTAVCTRSHVHGETELFCSSIGDARIDKTPERENQEKIKRLIPEEYKEIVPLV